METVTFRLLDKKVDANSFFLNADGTKDTERKLDFTNTYGVLNPYYIIEKGAGGVRSYRRYIQGCPTYDIAEQNKQGYVFNMQTSLVEFKVGMDIVLHKDRGGVLVKWLEDHPWNTSSPYHDSNLHPAVFFTYDPNAALVEEFSTATAEDEATDMLRDLRKDLVRMKSVAALFPETAGLQQDQEIYLGLRALAKNRPLAFKNSIGNRENQILSDILLASRINIIGKDAKGWFFEDTQGLILPTTKKQKDAEQELVAFFMTKEGQPFYSELLVKKQQKEIALNAPAGIIPAKTENELFDEKGQAKST